MGLVGARPIRHQGLVFLSTTVTLALICEAHWAQDRTVLCNGISSHLKGNLMMSFAKYQVSFNLYFFSNILRKVLLS